MKAEEREKRKEERDFNLFSFFRFQILSIRTCAVLAFGSQNRQALKVREPQDFATRNLEPETFSLSSRFWSGSR
jgi:hypothetical protein